MSGKSAFGNWMKVAVFNLFLLAAVGSLLRYKIAFALPWVDQKSLLEAHSHFAFSGWLTQAFMVLIVGVVSKILQQNLFEKYRPVLLANFISAYGMLFSFPFGGYYSVSIIFSTLSLISGYWFAIWLWRDLNRAPVGDTVFNWFKAAVFFMSISSAGPYALGYMMAHHLTDIRMFLIAEYFFLHFQYNGWFLFAGMGILYSFFSAEIRNSKPLNRARIFFTVACVPAYMLSILWLKLPLLLYWIIVLAVILQCSAWVIMLKQLRGKLELDKTTSWLWTLAAVAFSIKLLLQAGSTIPELSHFAFGYRPIVIGYLHLMLLGVCSLFVLGAGFQSKNFNVNAFTLKGLVIFVAGIIYNEILLFIQGLTAILGTYLNFMEYWLFSAALVMLVGMGFLVVGLRLVAPSASNS